MLFTIIFFIVIFFVVIIIIVIIIIVVAIIIVVVVAIAPSWIPFFPGSAFPRGFVLTVISYTAELLFIMGTSHHTKAGKPHMQCCDASQTWEWNAQTTKPHIQVERTSFKLAKGNEINNKITTFTTVGAVTRSSNAPLQRGSRTRQNKAFMVSTEWLVVILALINKNSR